MPRLAHSRWAARVPVGFPLVVCGAALWGTDSLFRRPLALELPATAVVFAEHVLLVALTAPLLVHGLKRGARLFDPGDWLAVLLVGAGASVVAAVAFTAAIAYDPNTALLLQQLQPLFAVVGARLVLGERPLPRYPAYFVVAVAGAWLIAFRDPTAVGGITEIAPAALAVTAAALWASGTVLGRRLTRKVPARELTALRFGFGLPASTALVFVPAQGGALLGLAGSDVAALVLLALIPGLLAVLIYYRGLSGTPATAATLGELAFPLTAILVNYLAFGEVLTLTQWVGVVVLTAAVTAMSLASRRGTEAIGVRLTHRADAAMASDGSSTGQTP